MQRYRGELPFLIFWIELDPKYTGALFELEKFKYLYVIAWLDRIEGEIANRVVPPWAKGREIGLFAGRSPQRPNPIGLSIAGILKVEKNIIYTSPIDFLDDTPVVDIKPYISSFDQKSDANDGWIEEMEGYRHLLDHLVGKQHGHDGEDHDHHHEDKTKG